MNSKKDINLESLFRDPDHYARAFDEFAKQSSKYEVLATWADTVFRGEVVEKLATNLPGHQKPLRIMGVGSGTGFVDCKMIDNLLQPFPLINNTVVEPTESYILEYKESATRRGYACRDWDWRQQTWQDFIEERQEANSRLGNRKFHFISAVHSLYHVGDLETALVDLMGCLEDGGVLLIILLSDRSGNARLWRRFCHVFGDDSFSRITSGSTREILENLGVEFTEIPQKSSINIKGCYEEGNEGGMLLFDFLLESLRVHQTAPPSFVQEVLEYMRGSGCSTQNGDDILLNNDWDTILVTKGPTTGHN